MCRRRAATDCLPPSASRRRRGPPCRRLGLVALVAALGFAHALAAVIALAIVVALVARLRLKQIGGQTGDVLGAVEQVSEIVILLVAAR